MNEKGQDVSITVDNSDKKLLFSSSSKKMYGGQIMAQSLEAAYALLDKGYEIISFNTVFLAPTDTDIPAIYHAEFIGGGNSIKFVNVNLKQSDVKAITFCTACREEETSFRLTRQSEQNNNRLGDYEEYFVRYIKSMENIGEEELRMRYKLTFAILKSFKTLFDFYWAGDDANFVIAFKLKNDIESHGRFINILAFISDVFLIHCASESIKFQWYDYENTIKASLSQNMSFSKFKIEREQLYYLKATCAIFSEGKAHINGTITSKEGEIVCSVEQIAILRKRER